jgi:predicted DNA-binding transcriptional regulator AlpA
MADINLAQSLLTETDVSRQLRVSLAALRKWRVMNRGPQFVKIGPLVRYRQTDIDAWLTSLPVGGSRCSEGAFARGVETRAEHGRTAANGSANPRFMDTSAARGSV